tara:strand:+ start:66 stop:917 length:852 start_codon:yes stop_codon:yes gene_type:complete
MLQQNAYQINTLAHVPTGIASGETTDWKIRGYWDANNPASYTGNGTSVVFDNLVEGENNLQLHNFDLSTGYVSGDGGAANTAVFEADGVDSYIGAVAGAYGSSFTLNNSLEWSVSMWFKTNTGVIGHSDWGVPLFSVGNFYIGGVAAKIKDSGLSFHAGTYTQEAFTYNMDQRASPRGLEFVSGTWYFLTIEKITKGGSSTIPGQFNAYVDGRWVGWTDNSPIYTQCADAGELNIAALIGNDGSPLKYYAPNQMQFGEIFAYSGHIGSARIQQNYLATKDKYR